MLGSLVEEREVIDSLELTMNCVSCSETNLTDVFRFKTVDRWLGIVPVWVTHETTAKCPSCDATVRSSAELDELQSLSQEQLKARFHVRVGFVEKSLIFAGWALTFTGPVSFVLFLAAFFMVPKASVSWKKSTKIGMIASVLFFPTVIVVTMIADLVKGLL